MEKVIFNCESVTPLFINGASGSRPEIRAASIKGLLRFWWRAAQSSDDIKALQKKESLIFGGVGDDPRRSSFSIQVEHQLNIRDTIIWDNNRKRTYSDYQGILYLYYSVFMKKPPLVSFKPNSKFSVIFRFNIPQYKVEILNAFKVLCLLGGLGARSRRGGGCIRITDETERLTSTRREEILDSINQFAVGNSGTRQYSSLHNAEVMVFPPEESWEKALNIIGETYQDFRRKNNSKIRETPNFGFPVAHGTRSRNRNDKITMTGGIIKENRKITILDRRASPLCISIIQGATACYFPVITHLQGNLLPTNYSIMDKKGNKKTLPSPALVHEFLDQYRSFALTTTL